MAYTYDGTEWKQSTAIPTTVSWPDVADKPASFTPAAHQHVIADTTGLSTALAAKANATTTIATGPGLIGGGTLEASRTLRADFGNIAGTVCEGSDSRLSDQRAPLDNSVTNAKVPAGANIDPTKLGSGRVLGSINGINASLTIWRGTKAQYDAKGTDDPNTVYVVKG